MTSSTGSAARPVSRSSSRQAKTRVAGRAADRGRGGVPPYREEIARPKCHHRGHAPECAGPPPGSALGCLGWPKLEQTVNLRGIILHMIEETARHAGHLDTARELLDGRTGLG
jgi:hypothetical protein